MFLEKNDKGVSGKNVQGPEKGRYGSHGRKIGQNCRWRFKNLSETIIGKFLTMLGNLENLDNFLKKKKKSIVKINETERLNIHINTKK